MTQNQRLDYLLQELCRESEEKIRLKYLSIAEKEQVLRSLMNVRIPKPVSAQFLDVQDAYLKRKAEEKGIVELQALPVISEEYHSSVPGAERISLWQGDVTRLAADGIVNAANSQMLGCFIPCHGCIDNAIHSAAGIQLRHECRQLMQRQGHEEPTGRAKVTGAYNLPAKYVIHTVGPIVHGKVTKELERDLENCYRSCLEAAVKRGMSSIAFCCISTGEFRFPQRRAAEIAVRTVSEFLKEDDSIKKVVFNVFKQEDFDIYQELLGGSKN